MDHSDDEGTHHSRDKFTRERRSSLDRRDTRDRDRERDRDRDRDRDRERDRDRDRSIYNERRVKRDNNSSPEGRGINHFFIFNVSKRTLNL